MATTTTQKTVDDAADTVRKSANDAAAPMRDVAEKTVEHAKENYSRLKSATEEATDAMEDSYATLSKSYKEIGRKSVEITRSNVNAHFDFLTDLLAAKSVSEAVELQTSYARKQFDVMSAQTKELSALAQKAATEGSKPLQDIAAKGMSYAKAS